MRPFFALDGEQEDAGETMRVEECDIHVLVQVQHIHVRIYMFAVFVILLKAWMRTCTCIDVSEGMSMLLHVDLLLFVYCCLLLFLKVSVNL